MEMESVVRDLGLLEVNKGDVLLVRAAARALSSALGNRPRILLDALLEAVGPAGTIVGLSFTPDVYFWQRSWAAAHPFRRDTPAETGGFAQALLNHPAAVRSKHPTNSFVAVGAQAEEVISGHDHTATSFFPIDRIMELGGKLMLVGCVKSSPGFSTVHRVQENLSLAHRTLLSGMRVAAFEDHGELRFFRRKDIAGCSAGFNKLYRHYVTEGALFAGWVGGAYSISVDARRAYAIERSVLAKDPTAALCDDPYCTSCGLRTYAPGRMARFALRLPYKVAKTLRR